MRKFVTIALICTAVACAVAFVLPGSRIANAGPRGLGDTIKTEAPVETAVAAQSPVVVRVTAKNFDFSPGTITLKKGVPVVLELTSSDRKHGFNLRAFGVRADVKPGEVTRVSFTPDKTGRFSFSCDVFCGEGHEDMRGSIVVTE